jgi:hypothetical protein
MPEQFEFELYRLNKVEFERGLFDVSAPSIEDDRDIYRVLRHSTGPSLRVPVPGRRASYEWAMREFVNYGHVGESRTLVYGLTIARSLTQQIGDIVTDQGIIQGTSASEPPLADTIHLFFNMARHLVAVEHNSRITENNRWRRVFAEITGKAAERAGYWGRLELEPIPRDQEVLRAFHAFTRLTRLRVTLRLPNPELSRYSQQLYNEMRNGGIQEYRQEMRNRRGLNRAQGHLPHASAELAQAGYKKGNITMGGYLGNQRRQVTIGEQAARGRISEVRAFVRGMNASANSSEVKNTLTAILAEIDRIANIDEEISDA